MIPFAKVLDIEGYGIVPVLDRGGAIKGNKIDVVTSLKVKDFFHLPRALIMGIESLKRIINVS